jgi:hypothetical protein
MPFGGFPKRSLQPGKLLLERRTGFGRFVESSVELCFSLRGSLRRSLPFADKAFLGSAEGGLGFGKLAIDLLTCLGRLLKCGPGTVHLPFEIVADRNQLGDRGGRR